MDKTERADLIRKRFDSKAGAWRYVPSGKPIVKAELPSGRIAYQSLGFATSHKWGRTEWLETPDAKPKPTMKPKNRKGVPAVTMIAAKAPGKLARKHAKAEGWLSERKRQSRP